MTVAIIWAQSPCDTVDGRRYAVSIIFMRWKEKQTKHQIIISLNVFPDNLGLSK